ncbi:winged helix-turn-helix DNA-binding domain protein [Vibrio phage 1.152.O._10N.222.46.E1]|uniref:Winged helix-turn-helix DNA-binding domain protein n=5 Tax=Nahantvirus 49C7 TaxID=2846601 RepID=A0A2I7RBI0_9CAUD|nr:HNH endonuclease [Vibrio phage 1.026.O._10N.222.49.C7]AUR82565.1 winged helix-turn-helix DNA-binding domain protein [Vibrio phage 1.025.O._10N.222.46.B6]AUR90815.1 winged helix-turn-helix DNA-binding domain protein [Vibrio phage 1.150.O._10N.222.46.A6]AUR90988.1 winged helix-turn-helix DNA-binding domain protein [Vibrio phage 1.152.O._10N.222.46.E1]AUS02456.1 winged helix-turn-helix DNA-binding domain protein [Vibrio phage 2.130.O._10N.222.46.C2]AUR82673.1 winged helix-turn-helix DNA-bindin
MKDYLKPHHSRWHNMMQRCYNPDAVNYKYYGGKGVTVCEEWHDFTTFAKWCDDNNVDGNDIDKDASSSNVYSPDTCTVVSHARNMEITHARYWKIQAPDGTVHDVYNLKKFARDNGLNNSALYEVMKGKRGHHKQWRKA